MPATSRAPVVAKCGPEADQLGVFRRILFGEDQVGEDRDPIDGDLETWRRIAFSPRGPAKTAEISEI